MPQFILNINSTSDTVFRDDDICCYLLDGSLPAGYVQSFSAEGRLVLLGGDNAAERCRELNADGVVAEISSDCPIKAQVSKISEKMGKGKALGTVICPRRHEAMLVSETEPQFVAFRFAPEEKEKAREVISWYNELFLIQCAVDLRGGLQNLDGIETDFVIINSHDYKDFGC